MALAALNTKNRAEQGVLIDIVHPGTGVELGIRWRVLGTDSTQYQTITRRQQMKTLDKQKKSRSVYVSGPEEQDANGLDILCGLSTGWESDVLDEAGNKTGVVQTIELNPGEHLEFTPENCRMILADIGYKWLREQVDAGIGERRNFL